MNLSRFFFIFIAAAFLFAGCATTEKDRQKAALHTRLGYQHLQQGDPTAALRELLEAQKLNPEDANVHYALGWAYSAKGLFPQALESYREALKIDPKFTDAHNAIGAIYLETGPMGCGHRRIRNRLKGSSVSDAVLCFEQPRVGLLQEGRPPQGDRILSESRIPEARFRAGLLQPRVGLSGSATE